MTDRVAICLLRRAASAAGTVAGTMIATGMEIARMARTAYSAVAGGTVTMAGGNGAAITIAASGIRISRGRRGSDSGNGTGPRRRIVSSAASSSTPWEDERATWTSRSGTFARL